MTTLYIDDREHNVVQKLKSRGVLDDDDSIHVVRLPHGDFQIVDPAGKVLFVIERKKYRDFVASVRDGRLYNLQAISLYYETQKSCNKMIIMEGRQRKKVGGMSKKTIQHFLLECRVAGFQVVSTLNIDETIDFVKELQSVCDVLTHRGAREVKSSLSGPDWVRLHKIYHRIQYVSLEGTRALIQNRVTLKRMCTMSCDALSKIKYESGRCIGNSSARKILDSLQSRSGLLFLLLGFPKINKHNVEAVVESLQQNSFDMSKVHLPDKVKSHLVQFWQQPFDECQTPTTSKNQDSTTTLDNQEPATQTSQSAGPHVSPDPGDAVRKRSGTTETTSISSAPKKYQKL